MPSAPRERGRMRVINEQTVFGVGKLAGPKKIQAAALICVYSSFSQSRARASTKRAFSERTESTRSNIILMYTSSEMGQISGYLR